MRTTSSDQPRASRPFVRFGSRLTSSSPSGKLGTPSKSEPSPTWSSPATRSAWSKWSSKVSSEPCGTGSAAAIAFIASLICFMSPAYFVRSAPSSSPWRLNQSAIFGAATGSV